jgi:hypothetical protein
MYICVYRALNEPKRALTCVYMWQGIYLPLLLDRRHCSSNPLALAYIRGHYLGLVGEQTEQGGGVSRSRGGGEGHCLVRTPHSHVLIDGCGCWCRCRCRFMCGCVCVHPCMHVTCMYMRIYVCVCIRMYACMCVHTCVYR